MKITAQDLVELGVLDDIVKEPIGGAHRDREAALQAIGDQLEVTLGRFDGVGGAEIRSNRRKKYLEMGVEA